MHIIRLRNFPFLLSLSIFNIKRYKLLSNAFMRVLTWQVVLVVKNLPANARQLRDAGLIPGLGRSPGGCHCCSVIQSCLTLCDPMDCSLPGFPVHHQQPEFAQTHVHSRSVMPSNHVILFSSCLQFFTASGSFLISWLIASCGQSNGASASASVLPMNIQVWFPVGLTGWISLQSKGLSRVFSNTTVQKHQFSGAQLSL